MCAGGYLYEKDVTDDVKRETVFTGPSAGVSIDLPFGEEKKSAVAIDYGYRATNPFSGVHSIGVQFEPLISFSRRIFGKGPEPGSFSAIFTPNIPMATDCTTAYYTEEGLKKLLDELHKLKTVDRPHISKQIADARDKGDLSENAEYHAAKEDQGLLEARIAKMEEVVASARVVDPGP
jgi:hypothetical protein